MFWLHSWLNPWFILCLSSRPRTPSCFYCNLRSICIRVDFVIAVCFGQTICPPRSCFLLEPMATAEDLGMECVAYLLKRTLEHARNLRLFQLAVLSRNCLPFLAVAPSCPALAALHLPLVLERMDGHACSNRDGFSSMILYIAMDNGRLGRLLLFRRSTGSHVARV